jgi:hypothetical protein
MHPNGCNFRVRTETECGSVSPWSEVTNSSSQQDQQQSSSMVRTFSSQSECGVVIQWDRAPSQGSRPQSLQVYIKKRNGDFTKDFLDAHCSTEADTTQCTVPSNVLRATPYFLTTGDNVIAKVIVSYSSWKVTYETDSYLFDVTKLGGKPDQVKELKAVKNNANSSIDITW